MLSKPENELLTRVGPGTPMGDQGILMVRKRFLNDLETIAKGRDPKAVIRDSEANKCVPLPIADRKQLTDGLTLEELLKHPFLSKFFTDGYPFQAGQPEEVRRLYEEAMGITVREC